MIDLCCSMLYSTPTHVFILDGRGSNPRSTRSAPSTPIKTRDVTPSNNPQRNPSRPKSNPSYGAPKKDGDKGASSHTVSESARMQLDTLLISLRESDTETSVTLPADLTNTQRKYVHELAKKLGLKSKSYGKGDDRKVVVSKIDDSKGSGGFEENIPEIDVGRGREALMRHWAKYPPNELEAMESRETGSSLLYREKNNETGIYLMNEAVNCLPDAVPEKEQSAALKQKRQAKHEQMRQRRIQSHKKAQKEMKSHPQYKNMMLQRKKLPAFGYAHGICNVLRDGRNQVVILTGDTGCG